MLWSLQSGLTFGLWCMWTKLSKKRSKNLTSIWLLGVIGLAWHFTWRPVLTETNM